tara:strand:+ start:84 stop:260 length:177 start_codon:yes stop_codon:yes gene_type:complete
MFNTLKTIAAELKRANDLKQRDIENKEKCNWYYQMSYHPTTASQGMTYTTGADPYNIR